MLVYLSTNTKNGKEYVGLTSGTLLRRRQDHESSALRGSKTTFHCALRKYGAASFTWIVLYQGTDRQDIEEREREEIASRRPAYNMTAGGDGIPAGYKHTKPFTVRNNWWDTATPEQRAERNRKISEAKKGKRPNWKVAPGTLRKGVPRTMEFKQRVSAGMKKSRAERAGNCRRVDIPDPSV